MNGIVKGLLPDRTAFPTAPTLSRDRVVRVGLVAIAKINPVKPFAHAPLTNNGLGIAWIPEIGVSIG